VEADVRKQNIFYHYHYLLSYRNRLH